jgi:hypothetical protein
MPLSTLHVPPRDGPRKTRGQDGIRFSPFLQDSFIPYFMPVYPGALERSTPDVTQTSAPWF